MKINAPKRIMVLSTTRRIAVMDALLSQYHLDRHTVINLLMKQWVLDNLDDDDLIVPVSRIFDDDGVHEVS